MPVYLSAGFDFLDRLVDELVDFDGETLGQGVHCAVDLGEGVECHDDVLDVTEGVAFRVDL